MAANEALYGLVRAREAEARARLPPAVEEEVVEEAVPRRYMPAFLAAAGW
jgi:DNA replicative helicase MCM subunit Mcm2 (Cdc46/Mcm family)